MNDHELWKQIEHEQSNISNSRIYYLTLSSLWLIIKHAPRLHHFIWWLDAFSHLFCLLSLNLRIPTRNKKEAIWPWWLWINRISGKKIEPPTVVVFFGGLLQVVQLSSVNSCQTQIMDDYPGSFFVWFIVNQIQLEFPPNMCSNKQPSVVQWSSVVRKWASIVPAISPVWASMACLLLFLSLDMFWAV